MKEINNKLIQEIISLYKEQNLSLTKIGEKVNLDRHTVSKILTDYGLIVKYKQTLDPNEGITGRTCTHCGEFKPFSEFHKMKSGKYGYRAMCKECCKEKYESDGKRNEQRKLARREKRLNDEYRAQENLKNIETRHLNKESLIKQLIRSAKQRAQNKNLDFNIEPSDITLPETCPLLEIPLDSHYGSAQDNSYSIDRIDSTKGYIKGNVWVISKRANTLKNNATLEELSLLVKNLSKYLNK